MTREEAFEKARKTSLEEGCVQHVNVKLNTSSETDDAYYVDDWFNCDSTIATFECGIKVS